MNVETKIVQDDGTLPVTVKGGIDYGDCLPPIGAMIEFDNNIEEIRRMYKKEFIKEHRELNAHIFEVRNIRIKYGDGTSMFNFRDNTKATVYLKSIGKSGRSDK